MNTFVLHTYNTHYTLLSMDTNISIQKSQHYEHPYILVMLLLEIKMTCIITPSLHQHLKVTTQRHLNFRGECPLQRMADTQSL